MSTEDNKAIVRRFYEEVWTQGNLAAADELTTADIVNETLQPPVHGLESLKQFVMIYRTAFPDFHFTLEDLIAEGDKVTVRFTCTGTQRGELLGIPPTGKRVTLTGIDIVRFADGKFAESWTNFDALGMLQQLGVISAPGQAS